MYVDFHLVKKIIVSQNYQIILDWTNMYNVYQPWDPLKVCVVGRSYPPEFYAWISNPRLRSLFERIAVETEEDFQQIIATLEKFNVQVIRPNTPSVLVDEYLTSNRRIPGPISMNPRDQMIMIGNKFYLYPYDDISIKVSGRNVLPDNWTEAVYQDIRGVDWPESFTEFNQLPSWIQQEVKILHTQVKLNHGEKYGEIIQRASLFNWWDPILNSVKQAGNTIISNFEESKLNRIPSNGITRIGRDLYFGSDSFKDNHNDTVAIANKYFSDYRCHWVPTDGHIDGCFTPIKPGLIVSISELTNYEKTFPDWEVVYLPGESWSKVSGFLELKKKNQGRWWIKGYEHDNELIEFVESWLCDWTGYAEESVFDVNILVIDQKNIIVNGYNKTAFDAFKRHGITAHICPVRHRYFWDGGVHCITLDLHREGTIQDYFPERC
jgi:hypothetical protein